MFTLEINFWSEHLNQLIYSCFYYCKKNDLEFNLNANKNIRFGGAIVIIKEKNIFFDYSDDIVFMDLPEKYDYYFKRSLKDVDRKSTIYPLNFNVPLAYNSFKLLFKLKYNLITDKNSFKEILEASDFFSVLRGSHKTLSIKNYPNKISDDFGGNVIFKTRLWNPDNNPDSNEKERRLLQNEFRINACRVIKKSFKNASVGLAEGVLANKIAPDLVISNKLSSKKKYLNELNKFNIGIADDGLKNTPGWKIGEYLLYGKAVITTPINISVENFLEGTNYAQLSTRNSYQELPDKIAMLQKEKKYLEMGESNYHWSRMYLHPANYIDRILASINLI